jgi:hypothetical protein
VGATAYAELCLDEWGDEFFAGDQRDGLRILPTTLSGKVGQPARRQRCDPGLAKPLGVGLAPIGELAAMSTDDDV